MKELSHQRLAKTIRELREEKGLTMEELGMMTGINRITIGRIEREEYTPSITQFEALSNTLGFDLTEMFVEKDRTNSFVALRSEALTLREEEGVERLFSMMLSLRQQIKLRSSFENESNHAK
ncbi:helix-turn-helix transcriptional regulator [Proteiniclasticum sp. QWL-01]|uniref:helix-turn-helix transcriptional regulator n=1 Tax=Proteiniclasticum sp. QWL-01 TaxID=3036945 RepID=UPI0024115F2D|nr:helix-turn-helix transcriptional regulator [Proteiniclasticum sp. QWL-01]WFF74435.1 helix-turn-helix transcriptional regulator [Proteiniclasticum sp. QWL-01]